MSTSTSSPASGEAGGPTPSASAGAATLAAEEIITAFWFAQFRGIRFRWDPAMVARLAKVMPHKWGEESPWLRMMPVLTSWHILDD